MRLWPRKLGKVQLAREIQEAEAARQKAREHQARARARGPAVDRLVAQLARHRNIAPLPDRIQAAMTASVVERLSQFGRDLQDEADRMQDGR